jgi:hypothetical protein
MRAGDHGTDHGIMTVVSPALDTWITPAQLHMSLQLLSSAGRLAISTVGAPGTQGAAVAGMQGIGVSTPKAAAVAAATIGLAGLWHMPNGIMFIKGTWSMIVAAGTPPAIVRLLGKTTIALGAAPKLHCNCAPITTCNAIVPLD